MKVGVIVVLGYMVATISVVSLAMPVLEATPGADNASLEEMQTSANDSLKNLYIIKAVVYEIGILTDENTENDTSFENQERVDLTFFDAHMNGSHIDLGYIPLPIQTNVSGQVFTGIAPINVGAFSSPSELLETLPLTGTIVNITHSDTALFRLTKSNATDGAESATLGDLSHVAELLRSSRVPHVNNDDVHMAHSGESLV